MSVKILKCIVLCCLIQYAVTSQFPFTGTRDPNLFQLGNAPDCKTRSIKAWFAKFEVKAFKCPGQSPYLNLTEYFWNDLECRHQKYNGNFPRGRGRYISNESLNLQPTTLKKHTSVMIRC